MVCLDDQFFLRPLWFLFVRKYQISLLLVRLFPSPIATYLVSCSFLTAQMTGYISSTRLVTDKIYLSLFIFTPQLVPHREHTVSFIKTKQMNARSVRVVCPMAFVHFKRNGCVSTHSVKNPNIKIYDHPPDDIVLKKIIYIINLSFEFF